MNITVSDIVKATGGKLLCGDENTVVNHIAIDSRTMNGNDIFVPIIGEKVDGHRFIDGAFNAGAVATFTSEQSSMEDKQLQSENKRVYIYVEDTLKALQQLGSFLRSRFDMPIIGVTGSVGKTTTREMITCALSANYKVTSTAGNHNGQIGVPLTLSMMDEGADVAVCEMGMSMPGEMSKIAEIVRPKIAVMINIGVSHIENLGSKENILKEKLHITDGFTGDDVLIVNGDDPLLKELKGKLPFKVLTYGMGDPAENYDYHISNYNIKLNVLGKHNIQNALCAIAVCDVMGVPSDKAISALSEFKGFGRRLEVKQMHGFTVIDDSYNASPQSMKAALYALDEYKSEGRKIAVLADMLELGDESAHFHSEVGEELRGLSIDKVFTVGSLIKNLAAKTKDAGIETYEFDNNNELIDALLKEIKTGDTVLLKGSNSMRLDKVCEALSKHVC